MMYASLVVVGLAVLLALVVVPQCGIAVTVFLCTAAFPAGIPQGLAVGGVTVFFSELALLLCAVYCLIALSKSTITDAVGAVLACTTIAFGVGGILAGYDISVVGSETRGLMAFAAAIVVAGRIVAAKAWYWAYLGVCITLWFSAAAVILGNLGVIVLRARADDASILAEGSAPSGVVRVLTPATQLGVATLAVCISVTILNPRRAASVLALVLPAAVITIFAFSRNSIVIIGLTVILTPILARSGRGLLRSIGVTAGFVLVYFLLGSALSSVSDIRSLARFKAIYDAYQGRVVEGFSSVSLSRDTSIRYREVETQYLRSAIGGNSLWFGHWFGYAYKPPRDLGSPATAYYAHNFYLWLLVKTGLVGFTTYTLSIVTLMWKSLPLEAGGIRAAFISCAIGFLTLSWAVPFPVASSTSVVLGALLAVSVALPRGWDGSDASGELRAPSLETLKRAEL